MPLETERIKELKNIYEPWLDNRGDLKEGAPQEVVEAYNEVMEWYDMEMDGTQ